MDSSFPLRITTMDESDDDSLQIEHPLEFRLRSRRVIAKNVKLLDPRRTVYRCDLEEPRFLTLIQPLIALCPWIKTCWPEWFLPPTVILKKQKPGWKDEFRTEIKAYNKLQAIQGTVIPYFYGEATYDASPTLVLSYIDGTTLLELACDKFPKDKDIDTFYGQMEKGLENAFEALTLCDIEYGDPRLDNCLMVDDGRVMIVDLDVVEFGTSTVKRCNDASAGYLFRHFKEQRKSYTQPPWYARKRTTIQ